MSTLYIAEALPGSGKTERLIAKLPSILDEGKRVVYSLPTNKLTKELQVRLRTAGVEARCINSESTTSVITKVEEALAERASDVLVITHEALQRLSPVLLQGWTLMVDEVPSISSCQSHNFNHNSYQKGLAPFVIVDETGRVTVSPEYRGELEAIVREGASQSAYQQTTLEVFEALLDWHSVVEVDGLDKNMKRLVRIVAYKDYLSRFSQAKEVHILANNVRNTLLGVHAKAHGWEFKPSPFTPEFDGYNCLVTIYPMVTGDRWSKSLCLTTPDGRVQDKWSDDVQGKKLLDNLYEYVEGEPVLVFAHSWMNYQHPANGQECSIDSRGLNNLQGYHAAACFQHGNMSPDDARSLDTLSQMMDVSNERIREALTYERFYESSLQCFLRTAIRDRDNQSNVSLFAQNEDMAKHLKDCLGRTAFIDTSLAHSPYPRVKSNEVMAKKALRDEAQYLVIEHGMSKAEIAKILNQPLGTIYRWTKGLIKVA
ncbi:hypothetical protein IMW82_16345 [Rhodanobacter sp. B2A1Ga4]|uniref:DEAD/DEAH box helicase n=1 Tax=Rhodanobacter sp. B2A1Ga4 TaxID=2778647 RepID=UPI001B38CF5D|nr:DEAD/DEAH box helicase [Rhodanobacter sp. B2A1Ga4]MBQ4856240.1 hypothetical protein [Rhodanobacter sp. B2A1Ga4]